MHLGNYGDKVLKRWEVCRAFGEAPRAPVAGTSTVPMFHEKWHMGLLLLDDPIALRAMDIPSKYAPRIPLRSEKPQEVRDAFFSPWIGVTGQPKSIQTDGGEWKNEVWADPCLYRRVALQFQKLGAHPWALERGIYNCLVADDRSS